MSELTAQIVLGSVGVYGAAGLVFSVWFVQYGSGRLDAAAKSAPLGFRLLILPGVAALWPVMAHKVLQAKVGDPR